MELGRYLRKFQNLEEFGLEEEELILYPGPKSEDYRAMELAIHSYIAADEPPGVRYRRAPEDKFTVNLAAYKTTHVNALRGVIESLRNFRSRTALLSQKPRLSDE